MIFCVVAKGVSTLSRESRFVEDEPRLTRACASGSSSVALRQKPDHRHRRLLPACRERPGGRSAEQRDELPPPHSITSSARAARI
jgi:hypothetical protein